MRKPKNPFSLGGYFGPEYFCDREDELKTLKSHFQNERNVVLFAWRRMGKTNLIWHFIKSISKESEHIFVDMLHIQTKKEAVLEISRAVFDAYGKTSSGLSAGIRKLIGTLGLDLSFDPHTGAPSLSLGVKSPVQQEVSMHAIGEFLSSRKKPVIVVLDEFQQVQQFDGEAMFRQWVQSFPSLRFIFSGSQRNMMTAMFTDRNRPFYRSSQLLSLGPIPQEAYKPFITNHFAKASRQIEAAVLDEIFAWAKGQTYTIQLLCNHCFARGGTITTKELQEVISEILEREKSVFGSFSRLFSDAQWQLLRAIAREDFIEAPSGMAFISKYELGAASTVQSALKRLIELEFVIEDNGGYRIHDVLYGRWLAQI